MTTAKRALEIGLGAERQLRELAGNALSAGEYDAIHIAELAKAIGEIVRSAGLAEGNGSAPAALSSASASPLKQTARSISRVRRTPSKGTYPKFFRRGDDLVKIGWSKKERAEYEHKAPRRVIDALATAISKRGANGRNFTSDDLFPLKDAATGEELPDYQAYVALAWFRMTQLVDQLGRRGYLSKHSRVIEQVSSVNWGKLPTTLR